jgi:hyperosmotically inducible periplasmic protein
MRHFFALLLVFLLLAPAAPLLAEDKRSDDEIYDEVRVRLAGDRDVRGGAFEVEVEDGVVTLKGKVRRERQKQRAERLARRVKGVTKVINELVVEPF